MHLSINPTYLCNFRCSFCYLSKEMLGDSKRLSAKNMDTLIKSLPVEVSGIDLYGGEMSILNQEYLDSIYGVIRKHYSGEVVVHTNGYVPMTLPPFFIHSVSWDYTCREKHQEVYDNMQRMTQPFYMLMLASECLIKKDPLSIIEKINGLDNLKGFEIKPYSVNQFNQQKVTHKDFEVFVQKFLELRDLISKPFINEELIRQSLSGTRNSFSNDHLYVTPSGKFAVLDFDSMDREYFLELDSYDEYEDWCVKEMIKITENAYCSTCEYYGKCLSEHLREVKSPDTNSCSGYKNLLRWSHDNSALKD